ncbi:DUF3225 domain-containing protein [Salinirussus salinus]|jgi:hypothetical protein|uniref:DUF3225 domain-containing protein n=1 Tax=Salinirussus salinus TaxID=1198300 RepID=UPI0013579F28|nr:DUF3225 domain-containing protein [Salinirussus salinus]
MPSATPVEELVREYYGALRAGDPLYPYFRESPATVKYGLSETLRGYEAVAAGLREQTRTTAGWTVDSRNLTAGTRDGTEGQSAPCGWFADDVFMSWTDTDRQVRYEFETRWSGTVVDGEFAAMHVSTAEAL